MDGMMFIVMKNGPVDSNSKQGCFIYNEEYG